MKVSCCIETFTDNNTVRISTVLVCMHQVRRGSRPNFEWVPSRIQKFRIAAKRRTEIFVLLGGSGGMLPRKILKIKLLRLLEIAFPTNILKITFFPSSHKLLFQLEIFSNKFHSLWRQKRHNCISGLLKSVNNV